MRFHALPDLVTSVLGVRNAQHLLNVANFAKPNTSYSHNGGEFFFLFCIRLSLKPLFCFNL